MASLGTGTNTYMAGKHKLICDESAVAESREDRTGSAGGEGSDDAPTMTREQ